MTTEEQLERARIAVRAARDEAVFVVRLHETWKPTAYDADLRARMGNSFATHSFLVIRTALRREVLMALMRLWDTNRQALKLTAIAETLGDPACFDALVRSRVQSLDSTFDITERVRETLEPKRDEILALIRKYTDDISKSSILERLRTLRHEHLAHRQANAPTNPDDLQHTDEEVEQIYQDTLAIVALMLSVVLATSFDIARQVSDVYRHHAGFFWAAARGERTEGHPRFRG